MTLASALSWRACASSGRIHRISVLSALGGAPNAASRFLLRAYSSDAASAPPPSSGARALSFSERLDRIPVRPHGPSDSVIAGAMVTPPHRLEALAVRQKYHASLTRQILIEKDRHNQLPGDWRMVLQILVAWTPVYEPVRKGVKLVVPEHATRILLSDSENNVWHIRSRTGCAMTLYTPAAGRAGPDGRPFAADRDAKAYIVLTGQPSSVAAAVKIVTRAVGAVVTVLDVQADSEDALRDGTLGMSEDELAHLDKMRVPYYQMGTPKPYTLRTRANEIPRPPRWTHRTFEEYVAALTKGRFPPGLAPQLYGPDGVTHREEVIELLRRLFYDPDASAAVSLPALRLALAFVVQGGATNLKDAQALVDRVERLGLRLDTQVFNLLAETAVNSRNLLAFLSTVRQMIAHGHNPDLRTWILFLRIIAAEEVRRYILHAMDTKNFFVNPAAVVLVSEEMAENDAYRATLLGQDVDTYLSGLRDLYGPHWTLTCFAANRMLDVFGRYSRFDESMRLLDYMFESDSAKPDAVTLNTVLTHCEVQGKVDQAVAFLRMFDEHGYGRIADPVAFHLLFTLARGRRKPHMLSAVWRYAHLRGMTSFLMRAFGIKLLAGGADAERLTQNARWLWQWPNKVPVDRAQFMKALLLCDYKTDFGRRGHGQEEGSGGALDAALRGDPANPLLEPPGPLLESSSDAAADIPPEAAADSTSDAAVDAALDASADTTSDAAVDANSDAAADSTLDVAADATSDAAADITPDAATDATLDAAADAVSDAAADSTLDAAADAFLDAPADAISDAAADSTLDAAADATSDAPADAISDAAADATLDAAADAVSDAAANATLAAAADATSDAAADAISVAAADSTLDAAAGASLDAAPDAFPEAPPAASSDAAPGVSRVPSPETVPDPSLGVVAEVETPAGAPRPAADKREEEIYSDFRQWAARASEELVPTIPLGEFLRQALERDRQLYHAARYGTGPKHEPGLPLSMWPLSTLGVEKKKKGRSTIEDEKEQHSAGLSQAAGPGAQAVQPFGVGGNGNEGSKQVVAATEPVTPKVGEKMETRKRGRGRPKSSGIRIRRVPSVARPKSSGIRIRRVPSVARPREDASQERDSKT